MSVELVIKYRDTNRKLGGVPIAAQDTFKKYWRPISTKLELKWIPLFESGLRLDPEDIPIILEELDRLKNYLVSKSSDDLPPSTVEHITDRIDLLIPALKSIPKDWKEIDSAFI